MKLVIMYKANSLYKTCEARQYESVACSMYFSQEGKGMYVLNAAKADSVCSNQTENPCLCQQLRKRPVALQ